MRPAEATPHETLADVAKLEDDLGVLSVYVHLDPERLARHSPPWRIEIDNALRGIRQGLERTSRERRQRITRRLDELELQLDELLDPAAGGQGRALFAAVDRGETRSLHVQAEVPSYAALDESAVVGPLAELVARGRPAGIVTVSRGAVTAYEWCYGSMEPVTRWTLEVETSEWRELKGPAAGNPELAQHAAPQRDRFDRRLEEHQARGVVSFADRLDRISGAREWSTLLLNGDPRLTGPLEDALPARAGRDVVATELLLESLTPDQIGEAVFDELRLARERRDTTLVERTVDAALAGGAGSLGAAGTLHALDEARVAELLIDAELTRPRATLHVSEGGSEREVEPEHVIRRTLVQGGAVTPVTPGASGLLRDHGGVGAVLRW